ncbi:ATP-dependent metallopeptidase FtsH/Yme1/Tma family protein [Sporolactobacillus shoreae]|uniref:ATP-dependent zinc metalloprotease FtsH n=1 Tax=Sporolactobacillus shoreae TaxID=1465501 RepID=A0A4Z0GJQ4_9BACL|nr:ATP-dependent zinc metalloprotease FtsH [Sporolactobacillus shoreae]TGA96540.1 ATP-dependent metallopeptidase FtsH/Yme1/Tma family protein [Sporolactobacillus shoreae]
MNRLFKNIIIYLFIFVVIIGIVTWLTDNNKSVKPLTYAAFEKNLSDGNVESATLQPEGSVYAVTGRLKSYDANTTFKAYIPASEKAVGQVTDMVNHKLNLDVKPAERTSGWITFLTSLIPFAIIFFLIFFLLNQAQGGGGRVMNFGKSKAKLYSEDKKKVTFKDVAGADEEKQELVEIVDFLKDPRKFVALGARIPKGVLLEGPPGTGKTLLARAVAGEAGVPFFSISGSDFVEMFVGVGASRVRDLFDQAKKNSPCIIFIDEIDAVGRQRGAGLGGGHDEREQTLNQLLVEMDGFGANEGIIIIAATNRPDILDPALLRPGRFDRQIPVNRPDLIGREAVLRVHARNKPLAKNIDLKTVAKLTPGFSGADLENLLNEAALVAARANKKVITMDDIDEAVERVIAGVAKKSRVISKKEQNIVAYHESGHTIVGLALNGADEVHKVTVIPRGQAGGYTVSLPKEDRGMMTKPELEEKICGLLGGRVAEEVIFGEISTGASNDLQRVTNIARRMVTEFGMSEKLGPIQYGNNDSGQVFLGRDIQNDQNYSDTVAFEIDSEVQKIVREQHDRCKKLLTEHRDKLELIAQTLLKVETLDEGQIKSLYETGEYIEPSKNRYGHQDGDQKEEQNNRASSESPANTDSDAKTDVKINILPKDSSVEPKTDGDNHPEDNASDDKKL